jgi:hypothetical protein
VKDGTRLTDQRQFDIFRVNVTGGFGAARLRRKDIATDDKA